MTGTIFQIWGKATNCLIEGSDGVTYWNHVRDFPEPSVMKRGSLVQFRLKLAQIPGKHPAVTDVIAA
jgi:hypothetical protein